MAFQKDHGGDASNRRRAPRRRKKICAFCAEKDFK